ncbi:MAG: MMPL family transporter [archaeon]|nr:MMPL family transporter [archaeon]
MIFESLANFITKHAKLIVIVWVVLLLASVYPAINAGEKLSYNTSSMSGSNTESTIGAAIIGEHFGSGTGTNSETMQILIITYSCDKSVMDDVYENYIYKGLEDYDNLNSVMYINDYGGMIQVILFYKPDINVSKDTGNLRQCIADSLDKAGKDGKNISGIKTYVTGTPAISYDAGQSSSRDMAIVDPIAVFMIIVLIGLFFRSFVASAAPPITIGAAFAMSLCVLYFLASILNIYYITEMLLLVSMLGAGCDYCIFILARYREERRRGVDHHEAVRQAIMWAGESVTISGIAVIIGFGSMSLCSFAMVSTMGLGLAIGIILALLAALTLMSSILYLVGDRLFWPTGANGDQLKKGYFKKIGDLGQRYFTRSTRFSIKHAKAIIVAAILFTVPMVYIYANSHDSYDMIGAMMNGESSDGMNAMVQYVDGGSIMPTYAVMETSDPIGYINYPSLLEGNVGVIYWYDNATATISTINKISDDIMAVGDANIGKVGKIITWTDICDASGYDEVGKVVEYVNNNPVTYSSVLIAVNQVYNIEIAKTLLFDLLPAKDPVVAGIFDWAMLVQTGSLGTTDTIVEGEEVHNLTHIKISMSTRQMAMSDDSMDSLAIFKKTLHNELDDNPLFNGIWVTGTAAVMYEISEDIGAEFGQIEVTAIILIIILLFFVMKSYLTPIRSVVTILMSVIWTVAITHLIFGDIMHAGVLWLVPILLLVVCLGLGMDYDILLTTRIKEYHLDKGLSNDDAISDAVLHSGSVITLCGLIMGGTFGSLCLASTTMLQQFGFALMFAILVDALIIRTYIVPAAMHLMGEWNWKGPKFFNRKKE